MLSKRSKTLYQHNLTSFQNVRCSSGSRVASAMSTAQYLRRSTSNGAEMWTTITHASRPQPSFGQLGPPAELHAMRMHIFLEREIQYILLI